ncbi:DNA-directed RNA polymerase subunit alpha C-terminal domain-containing protein [Planctomycetota bacterium]
MEPSTECKIDLYAANPPSMDEIRQFSEFVYSSEASLISFTERVEGNLSRRSEKASLANGTGLYILRRDAEAVEKLQKANDCKEKFFYLAFAYRRLGEYEKAIENLQKSLDFQADLLTVRLEKAETYRRVSKFDSAASELSHCTNFENVSADYHFQLARLNEAQGLYEEAMDNYATALELSDNHRQTLFHLAYCCDLAGDEEAAIDYYKQIASTSPIHTSALLNLAVLYEDAGRLDKATQCVDKILQFHPNHQRAILFKKDIESSKIMYYDEEKEEKINRKTQILETPISDFELSVRSRNCLRKMSMRTIGDLLRTTETELLSYKNFGETSLKEIKEILTTKGLHLGMALEEEEDALQEDDESEKTKEELEILKNPVDDLNLSVRARKCLGKLNLKTIGDLVHKTEAELLGCENFGVTSLNEINKAINALGLSLRSLD